MLNHKLMRWMGMTVATATMALVISASAGTAALAQSATVTPAPVVIAAGSSALVGVNTTSNVYSLPNATIVGQIIAGQTWFVVGSDSTGTWTEIQIDGATFGWVPTSALGIGNLRLPVVPGVTGAPIAASTAAPAATSSPAVMVAAGSSALVGVNVTTGVYDLPNGNVVGQINAGQTWFVVGRDSTGIWTEIQIDPVTFGWVLSSAVGIGNLQLPVVPGVTGK